MDRREMVSLKLQMGINPSVELTPDVLRAMWQQLKRERVVSRHTDAGLSPRPGPVTTNPAYFQSASS